MRRIIAVAVAVVALFGAITPASAQMPAPKVTITGLIDFSTSISKNWQGFDVTDGGKDKMWYSRERGLFYITAEVGRTKAVWGIELDGVNGFSGRPSVASGNTNGFDLDTDVNDNAAGTGGFVETKWLYLETPIMGPGSIMPFVPVSTIMRAGAQPARGHDYKFGIHFSGDFPGVTLESTWAPNLRSTVTYAQIGEGLDRVSAPNRAIVNEDWAILASAEFELFKGFSIKPTYSYVEFTCGNGGTGNLGVEAKAGFNPSTACTALTDRNFDTIRHTLGGDARFTAGPFTIQPTFLYQFGHQGVGRANPDSTTEIQTWIGDIEAGFRLGPFNVQGRFVWTPGMKADDTPQAGDKIRYYQPINSGFGYMGGGTYTEIQSGGIEYNHSVLVPIGGLTLRQSPSYDKYGRIFGALAADYALTPALTLRSFGNISWTDKAVDTNAVLTANGLVGGDGDGDKRFLGWEVGVGLTYRFAPNVSFDLVGAYMNTGDAMNHANAVGGDVKDADPIYKGVARVRFTF